MKNQGIDLSTLKKINGKYIYRNREWTLNKPVKSTAKGKKLMVLASKKVNGKIRVKLIHFGALGYGHNYSYKAKASYLKRSAGIKNKLGKLTKDDPFSANYWSRKILWPKNKKPTGPKTTK
jgi:hypothetical protein